MDKTTRAYIAGFLDGDGSIILQLKPRKDYRYGFQIKATISFYQKDDRILRWLYERIKMGALRRRPDGISEYDIEGAKPTLALLKKLRCYVVAKHMQVEMATKVLEMLEANPKPSPREFLRLAQMVESYQTLNYSKKCKYGSKNVERFLRSKGFLSPS